MFREDITCTDRSFSYLDLHVLIEIDVGCRFRRNFTTKRRFQISHCKVLYPAAPVREVYIIVDAMLRSPSWLNLYKIAVTDDAMLRSPSWLNLYRIAVTDDAMLRSPSWLNIYRIAVTDDAMLRSPSWLNLNRIAVTDDAILWSPS